MKIKIPISFALWVYSAWIMLSCSKTSEKHADLPTSDQYITWNMGGKQGLLTTPNDSFSCKTDLSFGNIRGYSTTGSNKFYMLIVDNPNLGYQATPIMECNIDKVVYNTYYRCPAENITFYLTSYGGIGGYIVGPYSGSLVDTMTQKTVNISGDFKVKRN